MRLGGLSRSILRLLSTLQVLQQLNFFTCLFGAPWKYAELCHSPSALYFCIFVNWGRSCACYPPPPPFFLSAVSLYLSHSSSCASLLLCEKKAQYPVSQRAYSYKKVRGMARIYIKKKESKEKKSKWKCFQDMSRGLPTIA